MDFPEDDTFSLPDTAELGLQGQAATALFMVARGSYCEARALAEGQRIRIFVSSPSDVLPERDAVDRVVAAANARPGGRPLLETVQ
jgi:hypothetical protein